MSTKKDILFLHYGPGGNSQIEKFWFEKEMPKIDYWDQPINHLEAGSYKNLLDQCGLKLKEFVTQNSGAPVTLLAHSFGCNLGTDLIQLYPPLVKKLVMLAPLSDLAGGFCCLARRLARDPLTDPVLAENIKKQILKFEAAENSVKLRIEAMWNLVGLIVQDPDFYRLYWVSKEAREKYGLYAKTAAPLDFTMWKNILTDYLKFHAADKINQTPQCTLQIMIGEADPYVIADQEREYWKSRFPQAQVSVLQDVGHYVHFEIPTKNFIKFF